MSPTKTATSKAYTEEKQIASTTALEDIIQEFRACNDCLGAVSYELSNIKERLYPTEAVKCSEEGTACKVDASYSIVSDLQSSLRVYSHILDAINVTISQLKEII